MTAQHQRLDRQQQSLDPQQQGMHEPDCIEGVQPKTLRRAELAGRNHLVVAGIGVYDATTAGGYSLKAALVEGLEECKDRTRFCQVLYINELISPAELTGREI
jgi:hypothetical protein